MLRIKLRKNKEGFYEPIEINKNQNDISPIAKGREKSRGKRKNCGKGKKQSQGKDTDVTLSPIQSNIKLTAEKKDFDDTLLNTEFDVPPIHSTIHEGKLL